MAGGAALLAVAAAAPEARAQQVVGAPGTSGLPVLPEGLEVVAVLRQPPGNVAVTPEGRIVMSQHQWWDPIHRVVELRPDGSLAPFPNEDWAAAPEGEGDEEGLIAVLGVRSDPEGVVWMLDNARQDGKLVGTPSLVGWDTRADALRGVIELGGDAVVEESFLNDLAIDAKRGKIIVSDPAGGDDAALIVVDVATGEARRVLQGHESVTPEPVPLTIDGRVVIGEVGGEMRGSWIGVDPVTIDPAHEYVYYGALNGRTVYRVPAEALADASLSAEELAARVEIYADRPLSDGETVDEAGNVYVTDVGRDAIGVASPRGYRTLFRDAASLSWPDGFSAGPDDWIYVTVNRLHESPPLDPAKAGDDDGRPDQPREATYLLRFKALAPIPVGR